MSRAIVVSVVLAACSPPPRGITPSDGNAGTTDGSPDRDAAIDAAPDALPDAPDASVGPFADPFAPLVNMPGLCSVDHWCWNQPTPAGNSYDHVFATAPDNIWLIGGKGTVLQWDGHAWHDRAPPVPPGYQRWELAFSISGLGPNDMWLVIGGTLQHWDGSAWTIVDQGNYWVGNVWEAPTGDVWCTQSGALIHIPPHGSVTPVGVGSVAGNVGGISTDDFWVASQQSVIHFHGDAFTTEYTGTAIMGMIGTISRDEMWFGGSGHLVHYKAGTWTDVPTGLSSNAFMIFVHANGANDVTFMAGSTILHWDGTALSSRQIDPSPATGYDAKIIDGKWWIVGGNGSIATLDSGGNTQTLIDATTWDMRPLWGSSATDMYWATSYYPANEIHHWDGTSWTTLPFQATDLTGVHTATGNEMFAAGSEPAADPTLNLMDLWHFDGTAWSKTQPLPAAATVPYVFKIWANGPGEAIAVGAAGFAYRYSAGAWTPLSTTETADFRGIWGPDPDHAYIVANDNTVLVWDRANPNMLATDSTFVGGGDELGAIHGADGIAWIGVTNSGAAWRHDAGGWTRVQTYVIGDAIWATSATDVVITTSGSAQIMRWNGTAWNYEDNESWMPTGRYLYRPPGGPMYAVQGSLVVTHP